MKWFLASCLPILVANLAACAPGNPATLQQFPRGTLRVHLRGARVILLVSQARGIHSEYARLFATLPAAQQKLKYGVFSCTPNVCQFDPATKTFTVNVGGAGQVKGQGFADFDKNGQGADPFYRQLCGSDNNDATVKPWIARTNNAGKAD